MTPLPPKYLCLDRAKNASTSPKSSGLWICIEKVALKFDVSNITSFGWAKRGVLRTDPGVHLSSKKAEVYYCSVNLTMAEESGRSAVSWPLFLQVWSFTNKTRLEVGPLEVCWAQSGLRSPWPFGAYEATGTLEPLRDWREIDDDFPNTALHSWTWPQMSNTRESQ